MGYILRANVSKDTKQKAIWWYFNTWMDKVGNEYKHIGMKFVNNENEGEQALNREAEQYAKNYVDGQDEASIEDLTDKENIKVTQVGDQIRIGPFKWKYNGKLVRANVRDQDGKRIDNVTFVKSKGGEFVTIAMEDIPSNGNKGFYIQIPADSGVTRITEIRTKVELDVTASTIYFLRSDDADWQNLIYIENEPDTDDMELNIPYDITLTGNLKIKKVNAQNQSIALPNVGFRIYNVKLGQYVYQDASGNISYNSTGTEFKTDANGEISIKGLILGDYLAYETTNPNYGYEFNEEGIEITVDSQDSLADIIPNPQVYVKLSGYVYLDVQSAKQAYRNNLYRSDTMDDEDQLLNGVQVRLVDRRTGNTVTNDNGTPFIATTREINLGDSILRYYQFVDVRIEDLSNYYIEFTYDGLTYQSVTPLTSSQFNDESMRRIGSVSAEDATVRDNFNKDFSSIEGTGSETGITLNESGQKVHDLSYSVEDRKATLRNEGLPIGQYPITATTDATGYSIIGDFTYGDEEIPYINLGIYEREQPDLHIVKDMYSAKLEINGYNHIYQYANRLANKGEYMGDGFNVGVQFGSEYGTGAYSRPIYKADAEYTNPNDPSRELKVYVTYAINVVNQATDLTTRVNSIVDYFDSRYTFVSAGTGIDDGTATVTGTENVSCEPIERYSDKYSKLTINTSTMVNPSKEGEMIYVQFELGREAVVDILNDTANLDNIAEITSYSSFKDGKVYAGVDVDSNPGNTVPEDNTTHEDDTDMSPSLKLVVADARELAGAVFEDKAGSDQLMTGSVRQGNGQYDESEPGIPGVEVTFKENKETDAMTYKTTTVSADGAYTFNYTYQDASGNSFEHNAGEDLPAGTTVIVTPEPASESTEGAVQMSTGDFFIEDYIPGDYTLTYTWGDETYTVQNYKGTVYDKARYDQNVANKEWYKTDEATRWTDAVDDYELRQKIDAELQTITNSTQTTIDKMNSSTPTMGIGVEKDATTSSGLDELVYRISNVDFGIIERARQDIALNKRVTAMRVTLANGRALVDITVGEDGTLTGTTSNVMYLPSSPSVPQGIIRLEMDDELMGGASLEIQYTITATNNSEVDYVDENFYKFGIVPENNANILTITPSGIVDYLDVDWEFDTAQNPDWVSITDINDERLDLATEVRESQEISNRKIIYTDALSAYNLDPLTTKSASVQLNVSKLMTSSEDIELDNETEIVKVGKTGGGHLYNPPTTESGPDVPATPGNYIPGTGPQVEYDDDMAERVIITSNTGANLNFILPISIVISAFVIIGVGVIFIKKKVLNK